MAPRASADIVTTQEAFSQPRLHGIRLNWDSILLAQLVDLANSDVLAEHPSLELPPWLTEPRGSITAQGFVQDTMAYLAQSTGGFHGTTLSPLTPMQSSQLTRSMGQIEMHPFIQACAQKLPAASTLVSGTLFFHDPDTDGAPMNLPSPPPPNRQIFI